MDLSGSCTSVGDDETNTLLALLDCFSCSCSLEDIAAAYCRASGDVNKAGAILSELLQDAKSRTTVDSESSETDLFQSENSFHETCVQNSSHINKYTKEPKLRKVTASFGTVSCVLGKASARTSLSLNGASERTKPPKIELPKCLKDDYNLRSVELDSAPEKETFNNKDIEEFLFSMLGEGFKLSMDVIREVLGSCGYDIKKSMEELLSFSAKTLEKEMELEYNVMQPTGRSTTAEGCFSEGIRPECFQTLRDNNGTSSIQKERSDLSVSKISPGELIESIFTVPERSEEEPKGRRFNLGENRRRVPDQKMVTKPLEDISSSYLIEIPKKFILADKVVDRDDEYQNLRNAAKGHWDMMKQYYGKAIDAFTEGNHEKVIYLLEQGKYHNTMARQADAKSAGEIIESKKSELKNEVPLDLGLLDATEASRLLQFHLSNLANIPSLEYLRVIICGDDNDVKKGQKRRRKVMRILEKNSIKWTEDEANAGTIIIRLDQIDPSKLSFVKGAVDM